MDSRYAIPPDMTFKIATHKFLTWLGGPGLPVVLLIVFALYSNGQTREMKRDLQDCQQNNQVLYVTIIEQNTKALQRIEAAIKKQGQ